MKKIQSSGTLTFLIFSASSAFAGNRVTTVAPMDKEVKGAAAKKIYEKLKKEGNKEVGESGVYYIHNRNETIDCELTIVDGGPDEYVCTVPQE